MIVLRYGSFNKIKKKKKKWLFWVIMNLKKYKNGGGGKVRDEVADSEISYINKHLNMYYVDVMRFIELIYNGNFMMCLNQFCFW